ncbi:hypothetical protein NL30_32445 [Burkholderia contaminans]|nr:hypothetical protein NL30_32445 [Burkholderia contaminans]
MGAPARSTQTRSFDADERGDRAGAADQFHHACCGNASTINARRRCRLPEGRTGRRARRGSVAPPAGLAAPRPIAPQIVLHAPGNLRRLCVLSGAERCANGFLP